MKVFNIVWRIILSVLLSFICAALVISKTDPPLVFHYILLGLFIIVFSGIIFASPLRKYLEYKD